MTVPILKAPLMAIPSPRTARGTAPTVPYVTAPTPRSTVSHDSPRCHRHLLHVQHFVLHLLQGAERFALPQPRLLQLRLQVGDKLLAEARVPLSVSPKCHHPQHVPTPTHPHPHPNTSPPQHITVGWDTHCPTAPST